MAAGFEERHGPGALHAGGTAPSQYAGVLLGMLRVTLEWRFFPARDCFWGGRSGCHFEGEGGDALIHLGVTL